MSNVAQDNAAWFAAEMASMDDANNNVYIIIEDLAEDLADKARVLSDTCWFDLDTDEDAHAVLNHLRTIEAALAAIANLT